jgi:hypothetical protein
MRNLVIGRITFYLQAYTELMTELDLTPDELESLSNVELLDIYVEILEIIWSDYENAGN